MGFLFLDSGISIIVHNLACKDVHAYIVQVEPASRMGGPFDGYQLALQRPG